CFPAIPPLCAATRVPSTTLFRSLGLGNPGVVEEHLPLGVEAAGQVELRARGVALAGKQFLRGGGVGIGIALVVLLAVEEGQPREDRKSTRLNSSHVKNSYAVFCL